ncbi:MAG: DUF4252 domain-containing protein [Paludibacteraceae bacterium]|nr:DUF4252 domain-containing protein [Paludibacteraceae bacterium]
MQRIIVIIAIIACSFSMQAQNKLFSKYATMDGIEFVCINKAMFNLGTKFISAAGGEDLDKLGSLDKMLIISSETADGKKQIDKDINVLTTDEDYELLMTSHSSDGDNVFIFTNKRKPHELIIGTKEQWQSSMIVIIGNFTKEDVSNFLNQ